MKVTKSKIIGTLGIIVISILIITWFFPFSTVSVYKNIHYTSNSDSVKTHPQKLDDFQALSDASSGGATTLVLRNLSSIYKQDWLVEEKTFKMNKDKLAKMLLGMQQTRNQLLNLTKQEEYTWEQRSYLITLIENVMSMEETIESMMNTNWENRMVLRRQFKNLSEAYTSSLMYFNSFYDTTKINESY